MNFPRARIRGVHSVIKKSTTNFIKKKQFTILIEKNGLYRKRCFSILDGGFTLLPVDVFIFLKDTAFVDSQADRIEKLVPGLEPT